ncbi:MAG: tetratricopeptide repeat protein, partial [Bacteroidota bacterium]
LYANTLNHGYALDDYSLIVENRITQKGFDGFGEIWSNSYRYGYFMPNDGLYRPIPRLMFAAEWEWGGGKPFLGHLMNVLLYALTGFLLYRILFRMTNGSVFLSMVASLVFIAHPVHTEVVANIKSRDEILAFLFCMVSLDFYLQALRNPTVIKNTLSGLFFFLALLSKESAITFLAILPLAGWFFAEKKSLSTISKGLITAMVACVVFFIIRANVLGGINTLGTPNIADNLLMAADDGLERFCTAVSIMGLYLMKLFLPHPLVFDYSYNQIPLVGIGSLSFLISFGAYGALAFLVIRSFAIRSILAFSILFFLITISLSSNIFITTGSSFGERFLYMPSFGFALAMAYVLTKAFRFDPNASISIQKHWKAVLVLTPIMLLYAGKTLSRNTVWKDNESLYSNDVKLSPNSTRTQYYMGNFLAKKEVWQGKPQAEKQRILRESIGYLQRSIAIYDKFSDAHLQMGVAYYNLGIVDSALVCYEKALAISPMNHTILNNMGTIYFAKNDLRKAVELFKRSVEIDPNYSDGQYNLGSSYGMLQQYDDALRHLNIAATLSPANAQIHNAIGITYRFKGDQLNSARAFEKAYALDPSLRPK